MKRTIFNLATILMSATLVLTSCHKKENTSPDDQSLQATAAGDASNVDNETNIAMDEANTSLSGSSRARIAAGGAVSLLFHASIDSSYIASGKFIINYNGKSRDSLRNRTGSITVQLTSGTKWSDVGSVITLTFNNYKVTRVKTGKSIIINGSKTITNVSGGNLNNIPVDGLKHTINGELSITFDDGTTRSWTVTKQRVITGSTVTVTGIGNKDNYSGVVYTGINRNGNSFDGVVESPIVYSIASQEVISGVFLHHGPRGELKVTFGVDNGTACQLDWTGLNGKSRTAVISYN